MLSSLIFRVQANDEPHGVFSLDPEQQSIMVVGSGSEVSRVLVMNVTRLAGLFGNASVGYRISGGIDEVMDIDEILGGRAEGRLLFKTGEAFLTVTVPISSQVRIRMYVFSFQIIFISTLKAFVCFPTFSSGGVFGSG